MMLATSYHQLIIPPTEWMAQTGGITQREFSNYLNGLFYLNGISKVINFNINSIFPTFYERFEYSGNRIEEKN